MHERHYSTQGSMLAMGAAPLPALGLQTHSMPQRHTHTLPQCRSASPTRCPVHYRPRALVQSPRPSARYQCFRPPSLVGGFVARLQALPFPRSLRTRTAPEGCSARGPYVGRWAWLPEQSSVSKRHLTTSSCVGAAPTNPTTAYTCWGTNARKGPRARRASEPNHHT